MSNIALALLSKKEVIVKFNICFFLFSPSMNYLFTVWTIIIIIINRYENRKMKIRDHVVWEAYLLLDMTYFNYKITCGTIHRMQLMPLYSKNKLCSHISA